MKACRIRLHPGSDFVLELLHLPIQLFQMLRQAVNQMAERRSASAASFLLVFTYGLPNCEAIRRTEWPKRVSVQRQVWGVGKIRT